jgi:pyruvate kinase
LRAVEVTETDIVTEVVEGGAVSNNKGINLPGVAVSVPALSEKDKEDLRWALRLRADMVALSFVRSAADIEDVHEIMDEVGVRLPVIAKIEKPQAVENLSEILDVFDGLMVARGDLGVELPLEQVPLVQKRAVELARNRAKPVIVATQVLESMVENSRPTRAEASDAANAVLDGADAVMLSGETSVGAWPIDAVRTMARIIENTEEHGLERLAAHRLPADHRRGGDAGGIRGRRPHQREVPRDVHGLGRLGQAVGPLPLQDPHAGLHVQPRDAQPTRPGVGDRDLPRPRVAHTDEMAAQVEASLVAEGRCVEGDLIVMVAGSPPGIPGSTNMMRVLRVGGHTESRSLPLGTPQAGRGPAPEVRAASAAWVCCAAHLAGVVEWQTRGTQNALIARSCGFKSRSRHLDRQDALSGPRATRLGP